MPLKRQLEALEAFGLDVSARGPVWCDKLDKPMRGLGDNGALLEGRKNLLQAALPGDRLVVADAYCLGAGPSDIRQFMAALASAGLSVTVLGAGMLHVEPGADVKGILDAAERAQKTAHMAAHRSKKRKS